MSTPDAPPPTTTHARHRSSESLTSLASLHQTMTEYSANYPSANIGSAAEMDAYIASLPSDPVQLKAEIRHLREISIQQHNLIKKLKLDVEIEHGRVKILRHDNEQLKKTAASMYAEQEVEEEKITNKLLKHIDGLRQEKTDILTQMEQEEEFIANNLQRRLAKLQKEKIELEISMEQEQEFMVNRLTKQLDELRRNQHVSPGASNASLNSHQPPPISPPLRRPLEKSGDEELRTLRTKIGEMEAEHAKKFDTYQQEIARLKLEIAKSKS